MIQNPVKITLLGKTLSKLASSVVINIPVLLKLSCQQWHQVKHHIRDYSETCLVGLHPKVVSSDRW